MATKVTHENAPTLLRERADRFEGNTTFRAHAYLLREAARVVDEVVALWERRIAESREKNARIAVLEQALNSIRTQTTDDWAGSIATQALPANTAKPRQSESVPQPRACLGCDGPLTTDGWNRCAGCGRQEDECGYRNQVHVGRCTGRAAGSS